MSQRLVDSRTIGIISKPHGIRGELNVMLLTDYPGSILKGSVLYLDESCTQEILVENIYLKRVKGRGTAVMKLSGIDSRDGAETLRGSLLYRKAEDSPVLGEDQYWVDDLEGCMAQDTDGREIGIVEEVEVLPSNENLVIRPKDSKQEKEGKKRGLVYVPLVDEYIEGVDIENKTVILKKLPEYL